MDHFAHELHKTRVYDPTKASDVNWDPFWYPKELPEDKDTILILAGDLWIGTRWIEYAGHSWIAKVSTRFKQVLVVLGNHDFWPISDKLTIKNGADKSNALLQDMGYYNVLVLDRTAWAHEDYLFVGCTLWTDMNRNDHLTMMSMRSYMAQDGNIAYGIDGEFFERFTSEKWVQLHKKHRDYINIVAQNNKDKKIFVITHHVPMTTLIHPDFLNETIGNGYYYSDLSNVILDNENITHWCYGHTHRQDVTQFEHCTLINNAVGYQGEHFEQQNLVKHEVIEI